MYTPGFERGKPTREEFIDSIVSDFCDEGHIVPLMNEVQIKREFLSESAHYPEETFWYLRKIADKVISIADRNLKDYGNLDSLVSNGLVIDDKTPYFDSVIFSFSTRYPKEGKDIDINNELNYHAVYRGSDGLSDGKLKNPSLMITIPFNQKGETDINNFMHPICHELTHVYDDWISHIHSGKPVPLRDFKKGNLKLKKKYGVKDPESMFEIFMKILYNMVYMTRQTEETAFISQTVQELYDANVDENNFASAANHTAFYRNLTTAKINIDALTEEATAQDLIKINNELKSGEYGEGLSVPRINKKNIDVEEYRKMIREWANRLYLSTLKKYYTVVWYYAKEYRHRLSISEEVIDYTADHLYF